MSFSTNKRDQAIEYGLLVFVGVSALFGVEHNL